MAIFAEAMELMVEVEMVINIEKEAHPRYQGWQYVH